MAPEPKPGLCDNLEGYSGMGGGKGFKREGPYVYLWLIHVALWQKPAQYGKTVILGASLVAQLVKNLPAMQETPVQFLDWEDPLEKV